MAQRTGFFSLCTQRNNTLNAFRQGDVVQAMMTQLREKESELTTLSEHRHALLEQNTISEQAKLQVQSKISSDNDVMAKNFAKIAMLEEESSKHLAETNSRYGTSLSSMSVMMNSLDSNPLWKNLRQGLMNMSTLGNPQSLKRK
jgi:hypothetical protein